MLFATAAASAAAQASKTAGAPETFTAQAQAAKAGTGAIAGTIQVHVARYTPDADRASVENALKTGGFASFLTSLRKAPDVGYVQIGETKTAIRYARQTEAAKGRTIVVVTEKPLFYLGGAAPDAKPRAGFEVGLVELSVDDIGLGTGRMAAAARVRPGGDAGVQIDDYAETPIKLTSVSRKM
jgi:hypothetical protein